MQTTPDIADSDEALMLLFQQGDAQSFETLVRRHADALLGFLVRMCRDHALAEDLFQETFLRVQKRAQQYRPGHRFKSWLFAIAAHLAIDKRREGWFKRRVSPPDDDPASDPINKAADPKPDPAASLTAEERKQAVRDALDQLPPRQRASLVLAYFEDMTYAEVAAAMQCSVGTVKTQVSRGLQALARILPEPAAGETR